MGDPIADSLLRALRTRAGGMTRTDIRDHFGRHRQKEKIDLALGLLERMGCVYCVSEETGGRPLERWFATEATKATEGGLMSHTSLMSQPRYLAIAKSAVTCEGQPPWE